MGGIAICADFLGLDLLDRQVAECVVRGSLLRHLMVIGVGIRRYIEVILHTFIAYIQLETKRVSGKW